MKNSKFWIWFIPLFIIVCIGIFILLNTNKKNNNNSETKTDAQRFKEEFEQYNNNEDLITISLNDNNSYVYATEDGIKELFKNGSGVLFLGNSKNNVSRNIIEVLNDTIMSTSVPKIFYYDIDSIKTNDNNSFYKELVNYLNEYLQDEIKPGVVVCINDGKIVDFYYPNWLEGKSEKLNQEEKEKLQKRYLEGISKIVEECDSSC